MTVTPDPPLDVAQIMDLYLDTYPDPPTAAAAAYRILHTPAWSDPLGGGPEMAVIGLEVGYVLFDLSAESVSPGTRDRLRSLASWVVQVGEDLYPRHPDHR